MAKPNKHPTYNLDELKRLLQDENTRYITDKSLTDATAINFSITEIIDTVLSLSGSEFYKTMPAENSNFTGLWQDVYKPIRKGLKLYIKLQKSLKGDGVVISFKKA
ncbi:MAG: type II toxin-antitoxin system MqsR family toxin [Deltaproteobacteria bacterium]|nr:type II toxin-antitoxin system MqsR family toxin [Deltaproteobacteria bacterium]